LTYLLNLNLNLYTMKTNKILYILITFLMTTFASAQYGIGTNTPHASAQLELNSSSKGFLPPRLTTTERNAISGPATGLLIYNSTKNCIEWFNGTSWINPCGLSDASAPSNVVATAGNAQASIAFTAPTNTGGSTITGYTVTSTPGNIIAAGSTSPIVVTGLTNGTSYTFTVVANTSQGVSAVSDPSNAVVPATIPAAPTSVVATAGNAQASVAFTAPSVTGGSAITGYTVTSNPGGFIGTGTSSPIIVSGLTNGTAYTFTVIATNAVGNSPASSASTSVTPASVPGAPMISGVTGGNAQASIAFTAPTNTGGFPITGYTVTSNPGNITATGTSSPITVTGLTNGTAYTFTMVATTSVGNSINSNISSSVTPFTNPSSPTNVVATPGNAQASIVFTAPTDNGGSPITSYTVTSNPGNITASGASSPIIVSGLTNGTAYTFTVVATTAVGNSTASVASSSVTPLLPPGAPSNLTPTPGNGQITVSWNAPTSGGPVTAYLVEYKLVSSSTWLSTSVTGTSTVLTGLTNNSTYQVKVSAVNVGGSASTNTLMSTPVQGTILLNENFNQLYTSANWFEVNSFSAGITPTTGNILLEDNSLRVGLGGSTYNSTYMRTVQNLNRNTTDLVIQFDVKFTNCANSFDGGEFFRYGPVTNSSNADQRFTIYKYSPTTWGLTSYNVVSPAGVNSGSPTYTCQTNDFYNVRVILPAAGGMRVFRDGVQIWNLNATQMPNTFTGFPFSFVNTANGTVYYMDNITISNN
jgi:hypothetical protein